MLILFPLQRKRVLVTALCQYVFQLGNYFLANGEINFKLEKQESGFKQIGSLLI